jgi:hypothetical protein
LATLAPDEGGRVVNLDSAAEPIDLVALGLPTRLSWPAREQTVSTRAAAESRAETITMLGAFSSAGPFLVGPGFTHRSRSDRVYHAKAGRQLSLFHQKYFYST